MSNLNIKDVLQNIVERADHCREQGVFITFSPSDFDDARKLLESRKLPGIMTAEGLMALRETPEWASIIVHLGHALNMSFNDVEEMLNNLYEICKEDEK